MNRTNYFFFSFLIFVLIISSSSWLCAQSKSPNLLKVQNTTYFSVTGDGRSENWKNTEWNNLPQHSTETLKNAGWNISSQPGNSKGIQYQTSFKVLYSNKGIYCLFRCEDSIISATLKGDYLNLYDEDVVEVFRA